MKFRMKLKKLLITAGLALAFGAMATGCGKKEAVPAESTQVETVAETEDPFSLGNQEVAVETTEAPTVEVIAEEDGAYVGVTAQGETQYAYDKYGPLGKEVWDSIALQWTMRGLEDEAQLRIVMDSTYGNMSTKEELTQDILALPRDPAPEQAQESLSAPNPTETKAVVLETNPNVNEVKGTQSKGDSPAQQTRAPKETQAQIQETQAPPVQETPAPTQETQQNTSNGFIPGTNIPSTGIPELDAQIQASENNTSTGLGLDKDEHYQDQSNLVEWN